MYVIYCADTQFYLYELHDKFISAIIDHKLNHLWDHIYVFFEEEVERRNWIENRDAHKHNANIHLYALCLKVKQTSFSL